MTETQAKKWLMLSIVGTAIIVIGSRVAAGKWPEGKRFIALGIFYLVAAMAVSAMPAIGGAIAVLIFFNIFLNQGVDLVKGFVNAVSKKDYGVSVPDLTIESFIPSVFPVGTPTGGTTGPGPCAKVIGRPGQGTHSAGSWENTNAFDLQAPRGTPITAPFPGRIGTSFGSSAIGGNRLHILGSGANPRDSYFAHLQSFATGISPNKRVTQGQIIGYVGDTGSARGTTPHLHWALPPPWNTGSMNDRVLQC